MTIAISIRVGEGLVYAADSTSSVFNEINGVSVLSQSFHHAQKLMQIGKLPIGVLTFGLGLIGTRNLESLLAEFQEAILPQLGANGNVRPIADGLATFIRGKYDVVFPPPPPVAVAPLAPAAAAPAAPAPAPPAAPAAPVAPPPAPIDTRPAMGIVVGGYSVGSFEPEEYAIEFPAGTVNPSRAAPTDFGVAWWGQTIALQRLLLGFDPGVLQYLVDNGVDQAMIPNISSELVDRLRWGILFDGMPMQDAIDLAVFLTNLAIGHSRFAIGPPVCGGNVDVATISHRGLEWIRHKNHKVKADSTFY